MLFYLKNFFIKEEWFSMPIDYKKSMANYINKEILSLILDFKGVWDNK